MKYKVTLNDKTYEVVVERGEAILVDEYAAAPAPAPVPVAAPAAPAAPAPAAAPAAPAAPAVAGGEPVAAPMPGTILDIKVKAGESGQLIAILEAMKMENEIFCPRDGVVAQVVATKGSSVDTGAPIIVLN